jgi:hypothetical protein
MTAENPKGIKLSRSKDWLASSTLSESVQRAALEVLTDGK